MARVKTQHANLNVGEECGRLLLGHDASLAHGLREHIVNGLQRVDVRPLGGHDLLGHAAPHAQLLVRVGGRVGRHAEK